MAGAPPIGEIRGELHTGARVISARVVEARPHTLLVDFPDGDRPADGEAFDRIELKCGDRTVVLGACVFWVHRPQPRRRKDDPSEGPGAGQLVFRDDVHDFRGLFRGGAVIDLAHKVEQLPLIWRRQQLIRPSFKTYTAELIYELQVFRALLDEVDRGMEGERQEQRVAIQTVAIRAQYPSFCRFFEEKLAGLAEETRDLSKAESEQHGFYFRKQLWDIILCSSFLARTNLKPRGYAGDSTMMRMVYENEFQGPTIFSKFMHKHPIETPAAQAVRNRRSLIVKVISELRETRRTGAGRPLRVLSVACGPARELQDLLQTEDDVRDVDLTLLDQDPVALAEAGEELTRIGQQLGVSAEARFIRESVRTMLRNPRLPETLGRFDAIYSMGLFDYLTPPVAKAVLDKLYELVAPEGELVVGNFHHSNPTRHYMDYWMDWVLYYRGEDELLELAQDLPGAECAITFEETGSQMFLRVRRAR
ncbi:MAG: class I SAM-dependent methyltransferase [Deltaproteobacteria bacterium]|nr:class I SAM-dependent methyltransferase [Deltaproteobacteria bacterium]